MTIKELLLQEIDNSPKELLEDLLVSSTHRQLINNNPVNPEHPRHPDSDK